MFTYAREGLLKPYYLWLTWHFHGGENCPCLCTLGVSQNQVSTSPTDTSIYASNNLPNLMTAIYSTLCTIWKFQVNYSHRISTSQLRMGSVCATCAPVFENLHVHIIPFCTRVVILQCHPKYVFWQVFALTSLLKQKRGKNTTKAIRFQSSWQWHSSARHGVWWDFIRSSNALQEIESKYVLEAYSWNHRMAWVGRDL